MKTLIFLNTLRVVNYLLMFSYIALLVGVNFFSDHNNQRANYRKLLRTAYTIAIGILLILLQYPIFGNFSKYPKETSQLMFSAGFIVLTTINYNDVADLFKFFSIKI